MTKRMNGMQTTKNEPETLTTPKAPRAAKAAKTPRAAKAAKTAPGTTAKIVRRDGTVVLNNGEKTTCAIGRYGKPVVKPGDGFVKINGSWELTK